MAQKKELFYFANFFHSDFEDMSELQSLIHGGLHDMASACISILLSIVK